MGVPVVVVVVVIARCTFKVSLDLHTGRREGQFVLFLCDGVNFILAAVCVFQQVLLEFHGNRIVVGIT